MKIKLDVGLNDLSIEWVQAIEKALDKAFVPLGFTRDKSSKSEDNIEFHYAQFGVCNSKTTP